MAAMATRPDLLGVTSFVRASWLAPCTYCLLLNFFHSPALALKPLAAAWISLALRLFVPVVEGEFMVLIGDGLKVPKEGRKMPGVKKLHQESQDNSKSTFIMGHSFQAVSILVRSPLGEVFAVPLICRICEGIIWARSQNPKTLLDKMVHLFLEVTGVTGRKAVLVADAYYASRKVIVPLLENGHHLITRVKWNTVAYHAPKPPRTRTRGRPKKYGEKLRLRNLFKASGKFVVARSPVYGEQDVQITYRAVDLLWRPVGRMVRFVLVKHPIRGNIMLLSTSLELNPLAIIKLYGYRFKIEVSFKQAIHTVGTYAYHFWMMGMKRIGRGSGNQHVENRSEEYRRAVRRKLDAYERYVQIGCIVQGLLLHLAVNFRDAVWSQFGSWLRTMKTDCAPSEMVVSQALKQAFPKFLLDESNGAEIKKFILERAILSRIPGFRAAS
jgi:hypothetical protein